MLKQIILDNFTTFVKPTAIDLKATNYKFLEDENVLNNRILKGILFVGENASGKTQILKALKFLLDLLFKDIEPDFSSVKSFYTDKKTSKLTYNFIIDNKDISYEIVFSDILIEKEILTLDNKVIMERNKNKVRYKEQTFDDVANNLLFLRRIYFETKFNNEPILNKWINYLNNSIYINCEKKEVETYNNKKLFAHGYLDEYGVKEINKFFKSINYNQEIIYANFIKNSNNGFVMNDKFVSFKKEGTNEYIPETLESTGNITLINLLPSFMYALKNDCLLIIDEFSSGFHNELEECLIKYFFHYAKNSQIIFVSHSTNLLNNTLIRPDQIYSISFKGKEGSVLKRFSDEMPREAQNTEKMYLSGVFDGVPRYKKTFKD